MEAPKTAYHCSSKIYISTQRKPKSAANHVITISLQIGLDRNHRSFTRLIPPGRSNSSTASFWHRWRAWERARSPRVFMSRMSLMSSTIRSELRRGGLCWPRRLRLADRYGNHFSVEHFGRFARLTFSGCCAYWKASMYQMLDERVLSSLMGSLTTSHAVQRLPKCCTALRMWFFITAVSSTAVQILEMIKSEASCRQEYDSGLWSRSDRVGPWNSRHPEKLNFVRHPKTSGTGTRPFNRRWTA